LKKGTAWPPRLNNHLHLVLGKFQDRVDGVFLVIGVFNNLPHVEAFEQQETEIESDFDSDGKPNLIVELFPLVIDRCAFLKFHQYSQPDRYRINDFEMDARKFMISFANPCSPGDMKHSLKWFVCYAYRLRNDQVLGGPAWVNTDLWEIQAKAAGGTVPQPSPDNTKPDAIALMLPSLLEERFRLQLHRDTREFPVYTLAATNGGSKLKLSEDQGEPNVAPPNISPDQPRGMIKRTGDDPTPGEYECPF
jgi:hypothetical protein